MANLQVKNLPDPLHQRLRNYAQKHHRTISDIVLAAIEREMARYDLHDIRIDTLSVPPPPFVESHQGELMDEQIREDVERGLRGAD